MEVEAIIAPSIPSCDENVEVETNVFNPFDNFADFSFTNNQQQQSQLADNNSMTSKGVHFESVDAWGNEAKKEENQTSSWSTEDQHKTVSGSAQSGFDLFSTKEFIPKDSQRNCIDPFASSKSAN